MFDFTNWDKEQWQLLRDVMGYIAIVVFVAMLLTLIIL